MQRGHEPPGRHRRALPAAARAAALGVAACAAFASWAPAACAHAVISPPTGEAGVTQLYTLSVPGERPERVTTRVELTVPRGFAVDAFVPARGWRRRIVATGAGESAIVTRVVWSGGRVGEGEAATFAFTAAPSSSQTYTFRVRQTYDDGTVVDWNGPEDSDTPAPQVAGVASVGGSGTPTVAIVAVVLGGLALVVALLSLLVRRGGRPLT